MVMMMTIMMMMMMLTNFRSIMRIMRTMNVILMMIMISLLYHEDNGSQKAAQCKAGPELCRDYDYLNVFFTFITLYDILYLFI